MQAAIARASRRLPSNTSSPPSYRKGNPTDQPILYLTLTSPTMWMSAVFMAGLGQSERNLSESLIARQGAKHPCPEIDVEKAIAWGGRLNSFGAIFTAEVIHYTNTALWCFLV